MASSSSSSADLPVAHAPAISAPMELPATTSTVMPSRSSMRSTPMWARPRAPPALKHEPDQEVAHFARDPPHDHAVRLHRLAQHVGHAVDRFDDVALGNPAQEIADFLSDVLLSMLDIRHAARPHRSEDDARFGRKRLLDDF